MWFRALLEHSEIESLSSLHPSGQLKLGRSMDMEEFRSKEIL